jgi:hypothetical protein
MELVIHYKQHHHLIRLNTLQINNVIIKQDLPMLVQGELGCVQEANQSSKSHIILLLKAEGETRDEQVIKIKQN